MRAEVRIRTMNQSLLAIREGKRVDAELARWRWERPEWLDESDGLHLQWQDTERMLLYGEVVWALPIIANQVLYEEGARESAPGVVVYSFDPLAHMHPMMLARTAQQMAVLRDCGDSAALPLRYAAWEISDDYDRSLAQRVPLALTHGRVVFRSALFYPREHIPGSRLLMAPFPAVTIRRPNSPIMMLPEHLWEPSLRAQWLERCAQ